MIEFERVTTRGGDTGDSSLYSGERRGKDDRIFAALGDVDELQSALGVARAHISDDVSARFFYDIQKVLVRLGAQVATSPSSELYATFREIGEEDIEGLESQMRSLMDRTEIPDAFVMAGSSPASAFVDMARSVARRAERSVVAIIRSGYMTHLYAAQRYLNRLSDYLFVAARHLDDPSGLR